VKLLSACCLLIATGAVFLTQLLSPTYAEFSLPNKRSSLLKRSASETKSAILDRIPIGTDVQVAKQILQDDGLVCQQLKNKKYAKTVTESKVVEKGPADFLWCDSGERGFPISKRWQVILVDPDGTVKDISVSVGLTGP
jgi:hypothetical protein